MNVEEKNERKSGFVDEWFSPQERMKIHGMVWWVIVGWMCVGSDMVNCVYQLQNSNCLLQVTKLKLTNWTN